MRETSLLRRVALAGALALSLTGLTAGVESAEAMPIAPAMGQSSDAGAVTAVQYMRYPHYRYRRFNRNRRAGLYRCGPGGLNTHLERKACR
ncbi:hypothetical protein D3273_15325 [Lichenibacterium minor]|uniref:BA14K family protein n=1 Tax=Lichenibacterium minor TaxID=2316528 RepID=A0A4V1RUG6_9HYPH|nr:hypothetical protein [Lichenibacterium minor]RYC31084.1 hypothetical protein D3273_15325 [Lichenibacterium minor]